MTHIKVLLCSVVVSVCFSTAYAKAVPGRYLIKMRGASKGRLKALLGDVKIEKDFPELSLVSISTNKSLQNLKSRSFESEIEYIEPVYEVNAEIKPNDPMMSGRKGLELESAWEMTTGNANVIIGVSDTGVNVDHEDLKENIWTNKKEIPGNGIDDDRNGFVDDINGWNFYSNTAQSKDDHNHGSHVAGLVAAMGNNAKGSAGATWHAQLMSLKFLSRTGSGTTEGGIETVLYAVRNGAHIINASWGGGDFSQGLFDAIQFAGDHNVLFVCAAGNDSSNVDHSPHYPSGYNLPNMLVVAATDGPRALAKFSNYGQTRVHVAAPGVDLMSAGARGNSYVQMSGTSMASPLAAGVAALALSQRPDLSTKDLRNVLMNSASTSNKTRTAAGGTLSAKVVLEDLAEGNQVWPKRNALKIGDKFSYTAWGVKAPFKWEVRDPSIASVDADGQVTALATGVTKVSVTDASGKRIETDALTVVK